MGIETILLAVSAGAGIGGTIKAQKAASQSAKLQQRQQEEQNRRSQRQAIREAQIRRAQTQQTSTASGARFGSGLAGGISSLGSQVGETLGYSSMMSGLNRQISMASSKAQFGADLGSLGFNAFNYLSGGQGFKALFPEKE